MLVQTQFSPFFYVDYFRPFVKTQKFKTWRSAFEIHGTYWRDEIQIRLFASSFSAAVAGIASAAYTREI